MIKAISKTIAKALINFIINDIYKDYKTSKKIIIDRNINL